MKEHNVRMKINLLKDFNPEDAVSKYYICKRYRTEQTTSYKKYNESEEYPIPCMLRSCTLQSVFRKPSFHRSDRTEVQGVPRTAHTSLASGSVV